MVTGMSAGSGNGAKTRPTGVAGPVEHGYLGYMEKATISQLKNRLSAYLRKVRAGETVLVLDRDRPIARIERIGGLDDADARLARLEAAGLVSRATAPLPIEVLKADPPRSRRSVLAALLEERAESA
ncbi:MAG: type II toxin-antitoxin system Phd/YefM family antitoxin [Kiloniellales bacterium]